MKHSLAQFSKSEVYFSIVYSEKYHWPLILFTIPTSLFFPSCLPLTSGLLFFIYFYFYVQAQVMIFLFLSCIFHLLIGILLWGRTFFSPPLFIQLFIYINVDSVIYSVVISPQKNYTEFYMQNPCKFLRFPFAFYLNDSIL